MKETVSKHVWEEKSQKERKKGDVEKGRKMEGWRRMRFSLSVSRILQDAAAVAVIRFAYSLDVFLFLRARHVALHGPAILVTLLPIVSDFLDRMLSRLHCSLQQLRTTSSRRRSAPLFLRPRLFTSRLSTRWFSR